jgi:excisionase family DNA binding protein
MPGTESLGFSTTLAGRVFLTDWPCPESEVYSTDRTTTGHGGMTPSPIRKILYSKRDAATALGLGLTTLDALVMRKELKPIRIGRRVLFRLDELERFVKKDHPTGVGLN